MQQRPQPPALAKKISSKRGWASRVGVWVLSGMTLCVLESFVSMSCVEAGLYMLPSCLIVIPTLVNNN